MDEPFSLDGRTFAGVANADAGAVDSETRCRFSQEADRISARYAGGAVSAGYLLGTIDGHRWDIRYVQRNETGERATGHSVGVLTRLPDGRIRVEDEWEWESKTRGGESVLEEVPEP